MKISDEIIINGDDYTKEGRFIRLIIIFLIGLSIGLTSNAILKTMQKGSQSNYTVGTVASDHIVPVIDSLLGVFAPNHIVSVDSVTFSKLTAYAFPHNVTVTETVALMADNWRKRTIQWRPQDINNTTIQVNIVRLINSNPLTYEFVKNISSSTPNIGSFTWIADPDDPKTDIEISCPPTNAGCTALPIII